MRQRGRRYHGSLAVTILSRLISSLCGSQLRNFIKSGHWDHGFELCYPSDPIPLPSSCNLEYSGREGFIFEDVDDTRFPRPVLFVQLFGHVVIRILRSSPHGLCASERMLITRTNDYPVASG